MQALSEDAKRAVSDGTLMYRPRVDLYRDGTPVLLDAPLDEGNPGQIQVDETAAAVRTGTLNFAPGDGRDAALVPLVGGPLQPSGTEAWVYMDLHLPASAANPAGAVETLTLAKLQMQRVEATDAGASVVTATGRDYAQRISDARLDGPYDIPTGTNAAAALLALFSSGVPGLSYQGFDPTTSPYLSDHWHLADGDDRWARGAEIARASAKRVRVAPDGVIQLLDVTDPAATEPVWTYDESAASILQGVKHALDRAGAASHAIVVGQPPGNKPAFRSDAYDLNPDSPTYFPTFGDVQVRLTSSYIGGQAQADAAADALLFENRGLVELVELTALPVHALEEGDAVRAVRAGLGVNATYTLSRFTQPLTAAPVTLLTRSRRVG